MDIVKAIFPLAFTADDKDSFIKLVIMAVIGLVVCTVAGMLLGWIPVLGKIIGVILGIADIYITVTLILGILVFLGILKK